MTDALTERVLKIQALAQGGYEHLVRAALDKGSTLDEFGMDLLTEMNRDAVTIAAGQVLPAGSILIRAYTHSVTANGGNTGDGTVTVDRFGEDVIEGIYTLRCTEAEHTRPDGGNVHSREQRVVEAQIVWPMYRGRGGNNFGHQRGRRNYPFELGHQRRTTWIQTENSSVPLFR